MRAAYLTSRFPFAHLGETFLRPEVELLAALCEELHVIPARPCLDANPFGNLGSVDARIMPAARSTLAAAAREFLERPGKTAAAFWRIAGPRYSLAAKIKNLALFPKSLAVSRYLREHHVEHIHANWLTTSSTVAYVAHIMTGIQWSCTAHAHDIFSNNLTAQKVASAAFVRVISSRNRASLNALTNHRYDRKTYVGHLGVTVPEQPVQQSRSRGSEFRLLCPARLHPMKGHVDLLTALAHLRDAGYAFHCDLAGDGEIRDEVEEGIARRNLHTLVSMRGVVAHGDLLAQLHSGEYDAVVLASVEDPQERRFFEGIPVALIEAMAAGIPCIATRIGSIVELIDDATGILVEQHDPASFAGAIARLIDEPQLQARLGLAARARVLEQFDVRTTTQALFEVMATGGLGVSPGQSGAAAVSKPANIPAANTR